MTMAFSGSGDVRRTLDLLWDGNEPSDRGPKRALTLEQIVAAAVELADREGVAALSMRKVAMELDVGTMSLYRYVPGKGELIDLMLDYVNDAPEEGDPERHGGWRSTMEQMAWDLWHLAHQHPWLLHVHQSRPILGPNGLDGLEWTMAGLEDSGLSGQEKMLLIMSIEHFTTGTARTYVLHEQITEESELSDEEFWEVQLPYLERAMESGNYPHMAKLPENTFDVTAEQAFERGLTALLDGWEKLIESR